MATELKAYNVTQLVDFICTRLEAYYIRRLLNVANGRTMRREVKFNSVHSQRIVKEDEWNYTVPSEQGDVYLVNISMGMCTCPAGSNGALCKHQNSVMQAFKLQGGHHLPMTSIMAKKSFYEMATGKFDVPETWFMGLQFEREDCPTVALNASTQEQADTTTPLEPQHTGAEEASSQSESVAGCLETRLRSMFDGLMDKLKNDETFQAPIEREKGSANEYTNRCAAHSCCSPQNFAGGQKVTHHRSTSKKSPEGTQLWQG